VDDRMKQRMVGAVVLVAVAVIFIPMLLEDKEDPVDSVKLEKEIPREPVTEYRTDLIPTEEEAEEAAIDSRTTMEIPLETITEPERAPEQAREVELEAAAVEEARTEEWVIVDDKASRAPVEESDTQATSPVEQKAAPKVVESPVAPPAGKGWTIQAGSFGQKSNAEKLMANLKLSGMPAYLSEIKVQDKTLYRVRIGPVATKEKAEQQLQTVEKKFKLKGAILPP